MEHVLRLEVAVNDAGPMSAADGAEDATHDDGRLLGGERAALLEIGLERLALEIFHREIGKPVVDAVIEDVNDVAASGYRDLLKA